MGLIITSLIFLAIGVFVFLTSVNYAWVLWEKERVDNLTKQIKPTDEADLFKRNQVREYTQSFDIRSMGKTGVNKAQRAYEKTMVAISDGSYPSWITRVVEIFNQTRKDFVASVRTFISYLLHLAKPDEDITQSHQYEEEAEERDVEETIARVKESASNEAEEVNSGEDDHRHVHHQHHSHHASSHDASVSHVSEEEEDEYFHASKTSPIRVKLNSEHEKRELTPATISLSSSGTKMNNAAFEKLEARILDKLKQSGLNHYAIWLELGELYMKYDEREKASEVFALVLKNTKNEKEKEIARNRLIGL